MSDAGNAEYTAGSGTRPVMSAVAAQWADRPPEETLHTAALADELGYPELWIGETAAYDAFALATAIGLATGHVRLTIGPLAVTVRDPAMIAMGAASVAALTRRPVTVALGTSSPFSDGRGRASGDGAAALADGAQAIAGLLAGTDEESPLRLPAPGGGVTVAAFGARTVRAAAEFGDRMVLDRVNVETATRLRAELDEAAAKLDRAAPRLAVRLPAVVDPAPEALAQLVRGLIPYLTRPGYGEMFTEAGFGEVVEVAQGGAGYQEVVRALPLEIIGTVGLVGSRAEIAERVAAYGAAGVDEIAIVPATAGDRGGAATLTALHDLKI